MTVFAISDLHLAGGYEKPMDVFGSHWADHFERIRADWLARVGEDDLVLLPGDTSWAMRPDQAREDLWAIGALPGRKVLLRGNHDFWWGSLARVRALLPPGMYALQNDALLFGRVAVCGSRGWLCPGGTLFTGDDARIYARELIRLELSLKAMDALCVRQRGASPRNGPPPYWRVAMLHFPPFADRTQPTEVTELLARYGVSDAVYGHLHGAALSGAFAGTLGGVRYHQVSCDGLGFALRRLDPPEALAEAEE